MKRATRAGGAIAAVCLLAATACSGDTDDTTSESTPTAAPLTAEPEPEEPAVTASSDDSDDTTSASTPAAVPTSAEPETEEPAVTASWDDGGASVIVVLTDGAVKLDPPSTDPGSTRIVAKNEGGDLHNLVIVKGDDPAALPVDEDGAVIEDDLPEGDLIGKIDEIEAGTEESASFDLDAGSYIVFCNIVVPTAVPPLPVSHFEDGMVSTFTVL